MKVKWHKHIEKAWGEVDRKSVAAELKVSMNYIHQVAAGFKKVSPFMAMRIEKASGGVIKKEVMRPDIWEV